MRLGAEWRESWWEGRKEKDGGSELLGAGQLVQVSRCLDDPDCRCIYQLATIPGDSERCEILRPSALPLLDGQNLESSCASSGKGCDSQRGASDV
jgi:hypothetical protein